MKPRTLYVLLALTFVLGGFILFFEKDLPSTDERREQAKKIVPLGVEDIEGMVIERPTGTLRFERRDHPSEGEGALDADDPLRPVVWYLTQPLEARADAVAVAGLLRSLTDLESGQRLDEIDRATAGLDDPVAKVTLQTADGATVLSFGAMVPASDDRIVAIDGEPGAHVAPASILDTLQRSTSDWRDKNLLHGAQSEIRQVVIESAAQRLALESRDGDVWLTEPLLDRADADRVDDFFGALVGLRAASFVEAASADASQLGLEPPRSRLQVTFEGRDGVEVLVGDPVQPEQSEPPAGGPGEVYARLDGQLVTVDGTALQAWIDLPSAAWRETAWSHLQVFQVEGAEITAGSAGRAMTLARQGTDWSRDGEIVDYSAVSDLLYAVAETEAAEVLDRDAATERGFDLQEPLMTLRLLVPEGSEELRLWPAMGDLHAATVDDREVVLLLAGETVAELQRLVDAVADATATPSVAPPSAALPVEGSEPPSTAPDDSYLPATTP